MRTIKNQGFWLQRTLKEGARRSKRRHDFKTATKSTVGENSAGAVAADIPVCRGGRHLAARINARFSSVSKVSRLFPPGWKPSSTSGRMPDATFYRRAIIVLRDFELRSEKGLSSFHVPA
jgi:hypothetical protein